MSISLSFLDYNNILLFFFFLIYNSNTVMRKCHFLKEFLSENYCHFKSYNERFTHLKKNLFP